MKDLLRTILGDHFPSGLLVVVGLSLLWVPSVDRWLGLSLCAVAVTWTYWSAIVQFYGARDGRPVLTVVRFLLLLITWLGLCGLLYVVFA